jgi:hypothetical protein
MMRVFVGFVERWSFVIAILLTWSFSEFVPSPFLKQTMACLQRRSMQSEQEAIQPFFDILKLPCWALVMNGAVLVLAVGAVGFTAYLWRQEADRTRQQEGEPPEDFRSRKDIAERSIMAALNAGLTSASVLMAGAFALLGFAKGAAKPLPTAATTQVILGVIWLVVSIFMGVWNAGIIAPKAIHQDVSRVPSINIRQMLQLCSVLVGGFSLLLGLFLI